MYTDRETESETIDDLTDFNAKSPWSTPRLLMRQSHLCLTETTFRSITPTPMDYQQQTNGDSDQIHAETLDVHGRCVQPGEVKPNPEIRTIDSSTSPVDFPVPIKFQVLLKPEPQSRGQDSKVEVVQPKTSSPRSCHLHKTVCVDSQSSQIVPPSGVSPESITYYSAQIPNGSERITRIFGQVNSQPNEPMNANATKDFQTFHDVPDYSSLPRDQKRGIKSQVLQMGTVELSPRFAPGNEARFPFTQAANPNRHSEDLGSYLEPSQTCGTNLKPTEFSLKSVGFIEEAKRRQRLRWILNQYRDPAKRLKTILGKADVDQHHSCQLLPGVSSYPPSVKPDYTTWHLDDAALLNISESPLTLGYESPGEVSPYPRDYGWPTRQSERFYTRLTQNGIDASKSQSLTRPKGKTTSPSRWKTENSRYGEHTLMDRSNTKDSKARSRRKVVKETSKPSSTAEKPELLRKAQSNINVGEGSEKVSRSTGKKPHPTLLVTKLRQRCQSIGRELDRLAESRRQVDRFVPTDSDETMESLTAANQALHDRLNEMQALQLEREKTLKKARVLVEDLITEQTAHAESIRNNVPGDSHASSDSLSPLTYDQETSFKPRKYFSTERRNDREVLFRSRGLRQPSYDRTNAQYKSYTYDFGDARRYERSGKIGERANSTQRILERLREDFAYLSHNVTQIEAKARDAAKAVNKLMQQARYLDDDQCIGPSENCEHTLRCLSSQMDVSPRISDSFTRSRTLPRNLDSFKHTPLLMEHQSQYCRGSRHLPYRPVAWDSPE